MSYLLIVKFCELYGFRAIKKKLLLLNVFIFSGDDLQSLLFHLLDEFLFLFSAEPFFIPRVSSSVSSVGQPVLI